VTTKTVETKINKLAYIRKRLHPNCTIRSRIDTRGMQLDFSLRENDSVAANFKFDEKLEGYTSVPHGGIISGVFNGAMGNCLFA